MTTHTVDDDPGDPEVGPPQPDIHECDCTDGKHYRDEQSFEDGAIEGVTPPAYQTRNCTQCGVVERAGLLDEEGRCEECSALAEERAESERRRLAIGHLLVWKGKALAYLTEEQIERIDVEIALGDAPLMLPGTPEEREAMSDADGGYGDLVSTIIWYPIRTHAGIICRNCQMTLRHHDLETGSCAETFLRSLHGDR